MTENWDYDHIALVVQDLDRTRKFYTECLGGKVTSKASPHFMEVMLGPIKIHFLHSSVVQVKNSLQGRQGSGLDHVCLNLKTGKALEEILNKLKASPLCANRDTLAIDESKPLGDNFAEHAESRPPTKTLFIHDPDGAAFELRAYD